MLIAGQAPGRRVHASGIPFDDASGDRLRQWLGLNRGDFYDMSRVAIVPMAFCFPGCNARGADLPPPRICGQTWHDNVMQAIDNVQLTVLVGKYAQAFHLGVTSNVTDTVRGWRDRAPAVFALPHPSWRNTAWLRRNPWFEAEVLPELHETVQRVIHET